MMQEMITSRKNPLVQQVRRLLSSRKEREQVSLDAIGEGEVLDALRRCQPDTLTPIEAMSLLYELKKKLS